MEYELDTNGVDKNKAKQAVATCPQNNIDEMDKGDIDLANILANLIGILSPTLITFFSPPTSSSPSMSHFSSIIVLISDNLLKYLQDFLTTLHLLAVLVRLMLLISLPLFLSIC